MFMFTFLKEQFQKMDPSAGITIATAIYSAQANKVVKNNVGMTANYITGLVLKIGGLKENQSLLRRSGIETILIPKENENDIDEIQ